MGPISVVGTWRLVSSEGRSSAGDVSRPYGDGPVGLLLYGPDGYMSATLMRPHRPPFASGDRLRGTPEEVRLASGMDVSVQLAAPLTVRVGTN